MIDYVCCADCGNMIPTENLLMHEAWSCRALPLPREEPPDLAENSQNSMYSSSSVLSDDSDGSEVMRRRRKHARYVACVAQARTVGMVEDGCEVDFSIAPYAAITPPPSLISKEGNIYNNDNTTCLEDYVACARAIGLIEDGVGDDHTPTDDTHSPFSSTSLKLGGIVLTWSLVASAMAYMQGTSIVEGIMQGTTAIAVGGFVVVAGSAILSPENY